MLNYLLPDGSDPALSEKLADINVIPLRLRVSFDLLREVVFHYHYIFLNVNRVILVNPVLHRRLLSTMIFIRFYMVVGVLHDVL